MNLRRHARVLRLNPRVYPLLTMAIATLASVRIGLAIVKFPAMYRFLHRFEPRELKRSPRYSKEELIWSVNQASRCIPGGTNCLARALTGRFLLARQGYRTDLRIGVAPGESQGIEAHAWLECQNEVLMGQVESFERFKPFPPFEEGLR